MTNNEIKINNTIQNIIAENVMIKKMRNEKISIMLNPNIKNITDCITIDISTEKIKQEINKQIIEQGCINLISNPNKELYELFDSNNFFDYFDYFDYFDCDNYTQTNNYSDNFINFTIKVIVENNVELFKIISKYKYFNPNNYMLIALLNDINIFELLLELGGDPDYILDDHNKDHNNYNMIYNIKLLNLYRKDTSDNKKYVEELLKKYER
jgi:hypothetical protein